MQTVKLEKIVEGLRNDFFKFALSVGNEWVCMMAVVATATAGLV